LDLKNKDESRISVVESGEVDLHEQAMEIEMLRHELSEQEKMLVRLDVNGMYSFSVCMQ
jgi:hypothetical protein